VNIFLKNQPISAGRGHLSSMVLCPRIQAKPLLKYSTCSILFLSFRVILDSETNVVTGGLDPCLWVFPVLCLFSEMISEMGREAEVCGVASGSWT
jgi:hypothetical protein